MCNIKNIVYSASSSYYGKQVTRASVETDQPDCQTSYSASKYAAEILIKTWGKSYQIRNVSLRYFNVYGRRSPLVGAYAPVVGLFFRQALVGQPLTVVGDGEQRRDFTHVSDVVEANILAMDKLNSLEYEKITNLTLNIGTGKNYSINEVANMVKKTLTDNCAVKIKNTPERVGEAHMSLANNELALGCLGWRPSIALAEGLDDLKKYYTNNMKKFGAEGDLIL
jgi:UDP-glucose 4-epimerase